MRKVSIDQLIARTRGVNDAQEYSEYLLADNSALASTATELMSAVQPSVGACALMSAAWAGMLKDHHKIPAIIVAGDLKIDKMRIFKCKKNIPDPRRTRDVYTGVWEGHCWIEIDGLVGDISIFRTAYALEDGAKLKEFVLATFGEGRGALVCGRDELPVKMEYIPKFVLTDLQIDSLIAGIAHVNGDVT